MCQRKIPPWQQEYCQQSQTQVAEEEGMGVDVEWPMPVVQVNLQAGRFGKGDLSMTVFSISCESILIPQPQHFPQPHSLLSLLA